MHVWNVLHATHWKYRTQKLCKIRHLRTIAQCCRAMSSHLRRASTIGKKLVKQQFLHNTVNFGPLTTEIGWQVWSTQQISTRFAFWLRYRIDVAQRRSTKLHDVWPSPGLVHYIYILGDLPPNAILLGAKFTLRPSFALSYIGSVTARYSSSGQLRNFRCSSFSTEGASYIPRAAITLGPHSNFFLVQCGRSG